MARCRRRTWLCICLPFILLGALFVYVTLSACMAMAQGHRKNNPLSRRHFIAPGVSSSKELASHPTGPFWDLHPGKGAFWNGLQVPLDHRHNPILSATKYWEWNEEQNSLPPGGVNCSRDVRLTSGLPNFRSWPVQMQEFVLSMHCREYPMLLDQPEVCGRKGHEAPMLLLAIKSEEGNFENRQAIRQTWGQDGWVKGLTGKGGVLRRVFLLGKQDASAGPYADVADLLEIERGRYRDILQWDFHDTFFNLTLKDVLFWEWFSLRCRHARFVFKGDDDVFVRTPALLDTLEEVERKLKLRPPWKMREFIIGDVIKRAVPLLDASNKYYIPKTFYKGAYPPYAGGGGVVYSGSLALRLHRVSKRVHLFPIDDVYLGMCLQRLKIYPVNHPGFLTFDFPKGVKRPLCAYQNILLVHKRTPKEILKRWQELTVPHPECGNKTGALRKHVTAARRRPLPHRDPLPLFPPINL